MFSGYLFDKQIKQWCLTLPYTQEIINNIDVLVDGRFVEELKDPDLGFRGSSNQRVINIKETINENKIILHEKHYIKEKKDNGNKYKKTRCKFYNSNIWKWVCSRMWFICCNKWKIEVKPNETVLIGTGIALEIPEGYAGLIYARSGLATKQDLAPANKVGVIDADYRGEIKVCLHNHGKEIRYVEPNQRIAQLIITPFYM